MRICIIETIIKLELCMQNAHKIENALIIRSVWMGWSVERGEQLWLFHAMNIQNNTLKAYIYDVNVIIIYYLFMMHMNHFIFKMIIEIHATLVEHIYIYIRVAKMMPSFHPLNAVYATLVA